MPGRLSVLPQLQREPFSSSLQLDDLGHLRLDVSSPTGALTTVLTQAAATTARDANVPLCSYLIQCRLPRAEVACNAPSPKKKQKNKQTWSVLDSTESVNLSMLSSIHPHRCLPAVFFFFPSSAFSLSYTFHYHVMSLNTADVRKLSASYLFYLFILKLNECS